MKIKDVLTSIPGIDRYRIEWWQNAGYIHPQKIRKGKINRREYSEQDLKVIEIMWRYTQEGTTPKYANQQALRELDLGDSREQGPTAAVSPQSYSSNSLDSLLQRVPQSGIPPERLLAAIDIERILDREYRRRGRDPPVMLNEQFEYAPNPANDRNSETP